MTQLRGSIAVLNQQLLRLNRHFELLSSYSCDPTGKINKSDKTSLVDRLVFDLFLWYSGGGPITREQVRVQSVIIFSFSSVFWAC